MSFIISQSTSIPGCFHWFADLFFVFYQFSVDHFHDFEYKFVLLNVFKDGFTQVLLLCISFITVIDKIIQGTIRGELETIKDLIVKNG